MAYNLSEVRSIIKETFDNTERVLLLYIENEEIQRYLERKKDDIKLFEKVVYEGKLEKVDKVIHYMKESNYDKRDVWKMNGILYNTTNYFGITDEIKEIMQDIDNKDFASWMKAKREQQYGDGNLSPEELKCTCYDAENE